MSAKKKILFVTQEIKPYTILSEISDVLKELPQHAQSQGMEIRILMPKFGTINERRHRLHEVVRLSGMNIIVNDDDYPLIIKVASLPGARMQVYFLDNEDFFKRKSIFEDTKGKPHKDNEDRMVFFCKGAIETVRKFGWPPDIIHCHGWMTSLIPMYLKTIYQNDPVFKKTKIVYSFYKENMGDSFSNKFLEKAALNELDDKNLSNYTNGKDIALNYGASFFSDAIILGTEGLNGTVTKKLSSYKKPILDFQKQEDLCKSYCGLYTDLMDA